MAEVRRARWAKRFRGGLPAVLPVDRGPVYPQYTASGSVAAFRTVAAMNPTTVTEVKETTLAPAVLSTVTLPSNSYLDYGFALTIWKADDSRAVVIYNDSGVLKVDVLKVEDDDSLTIYGQQLVYDPGAYNLVAFNAVYSEATETIQIAILRNSGALNEVIIMNLRSVHPTTGIVTLGSTYSVIATTDTLYPAVWIAASDNSALKDTVVMWENSSSTDGRYWFKTYTGTLGNGINGLKSSNWFYPSALTSQTGVRAFFYDRRAGCYTLIRRLSGGTTRTYCRSFTITGSYSAEPVFGSNRAMSGTYFNSMEYINYVYDPVFNGSRLIYADTADGVRPKATFLTNSGSESVPTGSAPTLLADFACYRVNAALVLTEDGLPRVACMLDHEADSNRQYRVILPLTSGTAVGGVTTELLIGNSRSSTNSLCSTPDNRLLFEYTNDTNQPRLAHIRPLDEIITNSADFIGISQAAILNGQAGPVAISGFLAHGLAGLTPGVTYYVNGAGALTTTDTGVVAGVAQSSTTLLVS